MKQKSPSIGIVVCARERGRVFVSLPYIQAIADHGGLPFLIPFFEDADVSFFHACWKRCDGFLFCGGEDVTPLLFDQMPSRHLGATDYEFDRFQLDFASFLFHHSDKPVLGICKGMQILNLACHGTIYQDLSENPSFFNHNPNAMFRHDPVHLIQSEEQTLLSHLIGKQAKVNSFHHQAVKEPGSGLRVCAVSPDGVIEAIEDESHPFLLGVQWHPEWLSAAAPAMQGIFDACVAACK